MAVLRHRVPEMGRHNTLPIINTQLYSVTFTGQGNSVSWWYPICQVDRGNYTFDYPRYHRPTLGPYCHQPPDHQWRAIMRLAETANSASPVATLTSVQHAASTDTRKPAICCVSHNAYYASFSL